MSQFFKWINIQDDRQYLFKVITPERPTSRDTELITDKIRGAMYELGVSPSQVGVLVVWGKPPVPITYERGEIVPVGRYLVCFMRWLDYPDNEHVEDQTKTGARMIGQYSQLLQTHEEYIVPLVLDNCYLEVEIHDPVTTNA